MLALKELRGSPLKFALIAVAIALVVSLTMLMSAMSEGLVTGMTSAEGSLAGDALVFQKDTELALERSLLSPVDLRVIAETPGVTHAYGVGHAAATVDTGEASIDAQVFGLGDRWDQLPVVEGRGGPLTDGETIADASAKNEGMALGDTVRLSPAGKELTVVGFTRDRRYVMAPAFYVDMATWEEVHLASTVGRQPSLESFHGSASVAAVILEPGVTPDDVRQELSGSYQVAVPRDAALSGNGMPVMVLAVNAIQGFSLVLGALVIAIFFYITTLHKSGQLAALKALGASNGYLFRQLVLQILALVTLATVLGTLLATGAGASMPPTMAFDPQPGRWGLAVVAVYVMALAGSLFSLHTILRADPATALNRAEH